MNLLSNVQEQLCGLSMKHAAKELEDILEKAKQQEWSPLKTIQALWPSRKTGRTAEGCAG